MNARTVLIVAAASAALAGCSSTGDLVVEQGVGITALRSVCPAVGVPDFTGNITSFTAPDVTTADKMDVSASITNLRSTCDDSGAQVYTVANFSVIAQRRDATGPRTVAIPYYSTVVRGGTQVVSKRVGTVELHFPDGQLRAETTAQAAAYVDRAAATLPDDIRRQITQPRRAGDASAAVDPLAKPEVRTAVARATFELLIGFQLTEAQLQYNATR